MTIKKINMKKLFTILLILVLSSCGPSAEEIAAREKIKNDSIALAAKEELLREQEKAEKISQLKQQLIELKAQLAGEESRLESIHGFHFLRSKGTKAEEVANQTRVLEELKAQLEETQLQLSELQ